MYTRGISGLYRTYAVGVLVLSFVIAVAAKYCYQCDSTLDNNCQEKWDDRLSTNQQKYKECTLYDAKFCVKITGLWGGVVGAHRFCSSRDMGDQCQDIWYPDHDRMYRACVYTCSGDGCNSATTLSTRVAVFVSFCGLLYMCGGNYETKINSGGR